MTAIIVDVETTAKGGKDGKDPSWFYLENKLLLVGVRDVASGANAALYTHKSNAAPAWINTETQISTVIGHNISFDIGWLYRYWSDKLHWTPESFWKWFMDPSMLIWDTMLAQYLLSGQNAAGFSLSLKSLCVAEGLVSESWAEGIDLADLEKISELQLTAYNFNDLEFTHAIYDKQLTAANKIGCLDFMIQQMMARKATIKAEIEGMVFDGLNALTRHTDLVAEAEASLHYLNKVMPGGQGYTTWSVTSNQDLGTFLFGGTKRYVENEQIVKDGSPVVYKSGINKGKVKTRKVTRDVPYKGLLESHPKFHLVARTPSGKWMTDEATLQLFAGNGFIDALLSYKTLNKDINTYFQPLLQMYASSVDKRIHPSYNHTVTRTGRLSSSKPNLQNITNKE